jgi:hypothetical protein
MQFQHFFGPAPSTPGEGVRAATLRMRVAPGRP